MDDKEKEKFGVIIDKDKQPQNEQPKVEESTPVDEKIDNQVENNQTLEQKQPENENVLKETSTDDKISENITNETQNNENELNQDQNFEKKSENENSPSPEEPTAPASSETSIEYTPSLRPSNSAIPRSLILIRTSLGIPNSE